MLLQKQSSTAALSLPSSSLLSIVPRSVVLARLSMTTASNVTGVTTMLDNKKLLLQSIYRYLKSNGFSKTVKKLKFEAKLDEDELKDKLIMDLEEIFSKYLETCAHASAANHKSDQEMKSNGANEDSGNEKVSMKKKKVKNSDHAGVVEESVSEGALAISTSEAELVPEVKTKEKKKSKKSSAVVTNENDDKNAGDVASEKLQKSKKKKKKDSDAEDLPVKASETKKRKRVSADDDSDKPDGASPVDKPKETRGEETVAKTSDGKLGDANHTSELTNFNNGDKSSGRKSAKKSRNGSAEPTTVKAFQRVKVDEVVIKDERLKDNSYWAKDGAESGYGAKAQEILGQVRGKDFRHEKTKKKRGSYRGGQIDFDSHSIKFNDSDDE